MWTALLLIVVTLTSSVSSSTRCDSWDCLGKQKEKTCDSWDCITKGGGGSTGTSFWKSRIPQTSFADLAELKCRSLPYKVYFDRKQLICVSYRPISQTNCEKIFGIVGNKTAPTNLQSTLQTLAMLGDQSSTMNCVYKFGLDCGTNANAVTVEDRCIEIVTTPDTLTNAATYCQKKGFALFVPHKDSDLRLLLGYLLTTTSTTPAFWIGQAAPGDLWILHDNTTADYFRWAATRIFLNEAQGGQFLFMPKASSNIGYIDVAKASVKAPFICARYRDSNYTVIYTDYNNPNGSNGGGANTGGGSKCFDAWDCNSAGTKKPCDGWGCDGIGSKVTQKTKDYW